ncbi:MAG: MurR/RpiR family transcriptional regulator [Paracoccaceae bacterium]|nr:MAG: MurR/RpiR family transcriptional regulator [Paracoccaceae bacterium]
MSEPDTKPAAVETFDALRHRIRNRFSDLSPHLQRIARSALDEPSVFALSTTSTIAGLLQIQPSTLIRFAKEFGYAGFSDLQKVFRQRLIEGTPNLRDRVDTSIAERTSPPDAAEVLRTCVEAQIAALRDLSRTCPPEDFAAALDLLRGARHVYIAGLRRSHPIASYLSYGLLRLERPCSLLDFGGGMAGPQLGTMSGSDLLVAIAFPPFSQPVVDVVMDAYVSGRNILAITDSTASPLARHASVALLVEAVAPSQLQPISGAIGLVQALVTALGDAMQRGQETAAKA